MIITNPPYKFAKEFVNKSLDLIENGEYAIFLLKTTFLEGKSRRTELFDKHELKYVWVFSERVGCLKNDKPSKDSSAVSYSWFVFQKGYNNLPIIDWI